MLIYAIYLIVKSLLPAAVSSLGSILGSIGVIVVMLIGLGIALSAVTGRDQVGPALDRTHAAAISGTGWVISRTFRGIGRLLRYFGRSIRWVYLRVYRALTTRGLQAIWAGALGVLAALAWIALI